MLAHSLGRLIILPRHRHEILVTASTGNWRRSGVGTDEQGVRPGDWLVDRHHQIGPDNTGNNINLVTLDEPIGQLLGHIWLTLVVNKNDLRVHAAKLSSRMLHGDIDSILHLLANDARTSRQCCHVANFHCISDCWRRAHQTHQQQTNILLHGILQF